MNVAALAKSPADLTITPRDRRFGRGAAQARWWCGGDPIATAFYNALSVTFPKGEAMFIDAVKAHRDGVPEKLEREIRAFVQQEVMHSREHVSFNKRVVDAGYDTTSLERTVDEVLALINARPKIVNLCATIALEHYTAILAQMFLNDPMAFNGSEGEEAQLWKWHAIEEIEHKGVAYDTWLHATRDWSRFRRWRMKAIMMTLVTLRFWPKRIRGMLDLLAQDGLTGWRVKARVAWFMLGKPGVLRRVFLPWLAFFMPGFHPWNEDDRHLIALNDSDYEAARLPQALAA
jgi:predicted metal-dependent hydrolase